VLTRRTVLAALGLTVAGCTLGKREEPGPTVTRVAYGQDPSQVADLHLPPGNGKLPVAVVIHGGFWLKDYGLELATPLARDLVTRGWAAYALEYRRLGNGGGWPTTLDDVARGIDALAGHAERLDLSRVVTIGHSAGGQLAAWAAVRPGLPAGAPGAGPVVRVAAVVSQAGVVDLVGAGGDTIGRPVADFLGATPGENPQRYKLASPYERLPLGVPVTLLHGTSDHVVPIGQSSRFVMAARQAGDRAELVRLPRVGHFELIDPRHETWQICKQKLDALISR
jgi:acetyl esterase/lipase